MEFGLYSDEVLCAHCAAVVLHCPHLCYFVVAFGQEDGFGWEVLLAKEFVKTGFFELFSGVLEDNHEEL